MFLVRHGRATGGWDVDLDPGLDDIGRRQADRVAGELAARTEPVGVVTSPLRRCRDTSSPLLARWGGSATVEPRVSEIPSPPGLAMDERVPWLRAAMTGTWASLGDPWTAYRDGVSAALREIAVASPGGAVVFSHFIAINAVIGTALGDDRLVIRSLDNCSITVVDVALGGEIAVVEGGHEADTLIR
jgi:broad specificity phosphatase PhoE